MFIFDTLTIFLAIAGNLAFVAVVQATPLLRRDVIAPKIITPNADTVWTVGHVETVTWNTSNFPPDSQITNPIGRVILGHQTNHSLNLDFEHPLASGFNLRDGSVQLTVPDVPPRDDYLIVLYGDSANTSPAFTITRITRESPPPSSSSASLPVSSLDDTPPPTQIPVSSTSPSVVLPDLYSSPPMPSSTTLSLTRSSASTSYSSASPVASPVSVNSGGSSLLMAGDKMALISSMACAVLILLI